MLHDPKNLNTKIILGLVFILIILVIARWNLVYWESQMIVTTTTNVQTVILEKPVQRELVKEKKLYKTWRPKDDPRQEYINETYKLWWMNKVVLNECEWYDRDPNKVWDGWHAYWLCQMNDRFHDIPDQYYTDRRFQIKYCFEKRNWGSLFYW